MPAPRNKPPEDTRVEPVGPLGQLIDRALEPRPPKRKRRLSYEVAIARVNQAAYKLDGITATYSRWTMRNWINRTVIPKDEALPWIEHGLEIPLPELIAAVDRTKTWRYEHNRPTKTDDAQLYEPPPQSSALHPPDRDSIILTSPESGKAHDVRVPYADANFTGASITVSGEVSERLDYALKHPSRLDGPTLSHLEQVLIALESIERHVEAETLIGATLGHLGALVNLLNGTLPSSTRRILCSIAGETAGLAARLFAQLTATGRADMYFRSGLTAAREAEDHALIAYLVGLIAGQLAYRQDPAARLKILSSCSPHLATPPTRVFLAAKEADAHALLGNVQSCLAALDRAESSLQLVTHDDAVRRPRAPWWPQEMWLTGEQGATLARLGHYQRADELLNKTLNQSPNPKHRLWLMVAMARVRAGTGEPDEASRLAIEVITNAKSLQMTTVVHEIIYLRQQLTPWQDSKAVRDLDESLTSQLRLPA